jgi:hypothetical protein
LVLEGKVGRQVPPLVERSEGVAAAQALERGARLGEGLQGGDEGLAGEEVGVERGWVAGGEGACGFGFGAGEVVSVVL